MPRLSDVYTRTCPKLDAIAWLIEVHLESLGQRGRIDLSTVFDWSSVFCRPTPAAHPSTTDLCSLYTLLHAAVVKKRADGMQRQVRDFLVHSCEPMTSVWCTLFRTSDESIIIFQTCCWRFLLVVVKFVWLTISIFYRWYFSQFDVNVHFKHRTWVNVILETSANFFFILNKRNPQSKCSDFQKYSSIR